MNIFGLRIYSTPEAFTTEVTNERLFPASRHRSARIHKKLVKRYGGEFKIIRKPVVYQVGDSLYAHPTLYEELKRHAAQSRNP